VTREARETNLQEGLIIITSPWLLGTRMLNKVGVRKKALTIGMSQDSPQEGTPERSVRGEEEEDSRLGLSWEAHPLNSLGGLVGPVLAGCSGVVVSAYSA